MKKFVIFVFIIMIFYTCKTTITKPLFIEQASQPRIKELRKSYYKYNSDYKRKFYEYSDNNDIRKQRLFSPIIYTNIEESAHIPGFPKAFFSLSSPKADDIQYFVEKMNGEYVLYMEKEGKVTMREYGKWYDFDKVRHTQDSMKVLSSRLDTDEKIFNYLKKNNIKYKFISKRTDGYYQSELKILLEANQCYTYITYSPNFIISNMYYNAKDTITLNNNFGRGFFK